MARGEVAGGAGAVVEQKGLSMGRDREREVSWELFLTSEDPSIRTCTMGMENIADPPRNLWEGDQAYQKEG